MKKNLIIIAFFLLLIVGISVIQTSYSLEENNISPVETENNNGKLHIESLSEVKEIEGAIELQRPQVSDLEITNISSKLYNPGDFITYTFSLINDSNRDIVIKDIEKNIECSSSTLEESKVKEICDNISIDLIYSTDSLKELESGDILFANSHSTIVLNLIYNNSAFSPENIDLEVKNASIKIIY